MSFYVLTINTTPKNLLFVKGNSTIYAAVDFSGANPPIYDPYNTITRFTLIMAVDILLNYSGM